MSKYLVIVESPAKAKTIHKYLGRNYSVKASVGHIRDLPVQRLGVNIEKDFEPEYELIKGKAKVVSEITDAAKSAEKIFLAPDPDREGEAIAWHLQELIKKAVGKKKGAPEIYRVLFNEITKKGVEAGMKSLGSVDPHKVDAQQARRILDRIVGYQLSPLLWDKVGRNLSAGRVQSVAVRLICDREAEIKAFQIEEYWTLDLLLSGSKPPPFAARLTQFKQQKIELKTDAETKQHLEALKKLAFTLVKIEKKERLRRPYAPFITSKLQQEAARRLGFTTKKTMTLAQRLYEGVTLEDGESVGLITYMRTDSTRISGDAITEVRTWIGENLSADYLPEKPMLYGKSDGAQDAHEAIRPTSVFRSPAALKSVLDRDMLRLYELIWKRFIASQLKPAIYDQTTFHIAAGPYDVRATGSILRFNGFLVLYEDAKSEKEDSDAEDDRSLPDLAEGETLKLMDTLPEQHFTQPPPRYSEAGLVKELEEQGIGRPSTYASIISTIQDKKYVEKIENRFHPTALGQMVNTLLVAHFARIMDPQFTAQMESKLDQVESGKHTMLDTLNSFYKEFKPTLEKAKTKMKNIKRQEIPTEINCPKCGAQMVIKWGRNGEFLACSAYPDCKSTSEFKRRDDGTIAALEAEKVDELCKNCGAAMMMKHGKFGKFLACSNYPDCKTTKAIGIGVPCPLCGNDLTARRSRRGKLFYGCVQYPSCTFASWDKPIGEACPQCASRYLVEKVTKTETTIRCPNKECGFTRPL